METTGPVTWVKSSRCSADSPQCIEVAAVERHSVLVRDSKNPDPGAVLIFSRAEWAAFRDGLYAGDFDRI